jgi:Protein of Unknown function (DUF2784)
MYSILDHFFLVSHVVIIFFALFGWIPARTRKLHLIFIGITVFSWVILGYFYGWGYCFWTDWHWRVREKLGRPEPPVSFIKFFVDALTSRNWDPELIDTCTEYTFYLTALISIFVNTRKHLAVALHKFLAKLE